jgi:hypothetical protein
VRKPVSEPLIKAPESQVYFDNNATIASIRNDSAGLSGYSEHNDTDFKFVRERYMRNEVAIHYVSANNTFANLLEDRCYLHRSIQHAACCMLQHWSVVAFEDDAI